MKPLCLGPRAERSDDGREYATLAKVPGDCIVYVYNMRMYIYIYIYIYIYVFRCVLSYCNL